VFYISPDFCCTLAFFWLHCFVAKYFFSTGSCFFKEQTCEVNEEVFSHGMSARIMSARISPVDVHIIRIMEKAFVLQSQAS
jgi:hypothetical protein